MTTPANGLFGPGIFGTGIDLSALDEDTALKLGLWTGQQIKEAEERGYARAVAEQVTKELADDGVRYLLWDNERGMWWKPNGRGYTHDRSEAGRYTRDEAVKWALSGALHGDLEHANVIIAAHRTPPTPKTPALNR